jgi:UrcA family protein
MIRIMLLAATSALSPNAPAHNSGIYLEGPSTAHVRYSDLDVHSPDGRSRLTTRIRSAAQMICVDGSTDPLFINPGRVECYRVAVASGLSQMDLIANR